MQISQIKRELTLASSSISGNAIIWKCRKSLAVIGFLPPPGGPMAVTKFTSLISLKYPICFLSYHPEKDRSRLNFYSSSRATLNRIIYDWASFIASIYRLLILHFIIPSINMAQCSEQGSHLSGIQFSKINEQVTHASVTLFYGSHRCYVIRAISRGRRINYASVRISVMWNSVHVADRSQQHHLGSYYAARANRLLKFVKFWTPKDGNLILNRLNIKYLLFKWIIISRIIFIRR